MEEKQKITVVPWDFTPVAENALAHAVKISHMVHNEICLLHIVDKAIKPAEEGQKMAALKLVANENSTKYNVPISVHISKGSIFSAIADFVNDKDKKHEKEANIVVMGTHGMKGMQKLTGSWALKVIVGSKVPFIVIQDPSSDQKSLSLLSRIHLLTRSGITISFFLSILRRRTRRRSRWQSSWANISNRRCICS